MARTLLISIMCVMAALTVMAQEVRPYEPLFVDGKSWIYKYDSYLHPETNETQTYTVCGDTIFDGRECKRIRFHSEKGLYQDRDYIVYEEDGRSFAIFYEEYSSIYHYLPLFDFSVKVGDRIEQRTDPQTVKYTAIVSKIEDIDIKGYKRRRICLDDANILGNGRWIEGIGSNRFSTIYIMNWPTNGSWEYLVECRQGDEVIFTAEDFDAPGLSDVESVAVEDAQGEGMIYDIYGRRVEHPQRGHIYIRDGRKFVQR